MVKGWCKGWTLFMTESESRGPCGFGWDFGYNCIRAVTYLLPTTCPSSPQKCPSQKYTQIFLHTNLHLRVCILRKLAWNSCIGYECQLLSPIIRYHHRVFFSFLLHICDSFLWQWETWLPLFTIYLFICSVLKYISCSFRFAKHDSMKNPHDNIQ